jgi:hypothetical protein
MPKRFLICLLGWAIFLLSLKEFVETEGAALSLRYAGEYVEPRNKMERTDWQ